MEQLFFKNIQVIAFLSRLNAKINTTHQEKSTQVSANNVKLFLIGRDRVTRLKGCYGNSRLFRAQQDKT